MMIAHDSLERQRMLAYLNAMVVFSTVWWVEESMRDDRPWFIDDKGHVYFQSPLKCALLKHDPEPISRPGRIPMCRDCYCLWWRVR